MTDYRAFRIHQDAAGHRAGIERLPLREPGEGEVLIRVAWSGINYKDALAGTGRGKILKTFPLVGGVDAAGQVERSGSPAFREGDAVLITGYGMSFDHDGGFAEYLCCPADWVVPIPAGLDPRSAMILGTAGFTAAFALHRMLVNGQHPGLGPILVTGASGGVGAIAVNLFSHLGFEVAAVSGKAELHDWLRGLGAGQILGRNDLPGGSRPLERAVWGGAVDNVGGDMLAQITRTVTRLGQHRQHRPGGRTRAAHHGHALHPARGQPARHQLRRGPSAPARGAVGTPGERLASPADRGNPKRHRRPRRPGRGLRADAQGSVPRAGTGAHRRLRGRVPESLERQDAGGIVVGQLHTQTLFAVNARPP